MAYRRIPVEFLIFAAGFATIFGAVALTNFVVDPFQYFRAADHPRFSNLMQRHQVPGVVRNYAFDSIVVGSSTMANLSPVRFKAASIPDVLNLSFWGGTANEASRVIRLSLREKHLKTVYWAIDPALITNDFRYPDFPFCMYDRLLSLLPYCYLFSRDIFVESIATFLPDITIGRAGWVGDIEAWKSVSAAPFSHREFGCEIKRRLGNTRQLDAALLGEMKTRFLDLVVNLVEAHPQTSFRIVFPPMYAPELWLRSHDQPENLPFIDWAQRILVKLPNVSIFDFQLADLTTDETRFRDALHTYPEVSDEMARWLVSDKFRLLPGDMDRASTARKESAMEGEQLAAHYQCSQGLK